MKRIASVGIVLALALPALADEKPDYSRANSLNVTELELCQDHIANDDDEGPRDHQTGRSKA